MAASLQSVVASIRLQDYTARMFVDSSACYHIRLNLIVFLVATISAIGYDYCE